MALLEQAPQSDETIKSEPTVDSLAGLPDSLMEQAQPDVIEPTLSEKYSVLRREMFSQCLGVMAFHGAHAPESIEDGPSNPELERVIDFLYEIRNRVLAVCAESIPEGNPVPLEDISNAMFRKLVENHGGLTLAEYAARSVQIGRAGYPLSVPQFIPPFAQLVAEEGFPYPTARRRADIFITDKLPTYLEQELEHEQNNNGRSYSAIPSGKM